VWPGVVIVAVQWLGRLVLPLIVPGAADIALLVWVGAGVAVLAWWLFFSRAPWSERAGALVLMVVAMYATWPLLHESIAGGAMGRLPIVLAIPTLSLALVVWAVLTRHLSAVPRRAALAVAIVLGCGVWTLARTGGVRGGGFDLSWRWTPTPEERLLAEAPEPILDSRRMRPEGSSTPAPPEPARETPRHAEPAAPVDAGTPAPAAPAAVHAPATEVATAPPVEKTAPEWPGFRGPHRDSIVPGVRIATDWARSRPVELWRQPIGPGWSSFAVHGGHIYTQEQRGDDEIVACYDLATGEPVWRHRDAARFWESNGGPGPRATPTLSNGRVYTLGATGIVNALDARDGSVVWSRNAVDDAEKKVPYWGIAASPLVIDDLVIVAASGRLVAYEIGSGTPRWRGPDGGVSYSSPHLVTIDGVPQVVLLHAGGATSVAVSDGAKLWEHSWDGGAIVQPAIIADGDILISTNAMTGGNGLRRITVGHGPDGWTVEERWTSTGLKPYFNDFVVHEGHVYGFDGSILSCVGLEDGARRWKGGRYGNGQLVLLRDQSVLLVLSEEGELALVSATPDRFTEIARFPALEGKTWNHPVLVRDLLLVRNGEEMVAFRLPVVGS
jgi:outer membrane protein assembly factor BamB